MTISSSRSGLSQLEKQLELLTAFNLQVPCNPQGDFAKAGADHIYVQVEACPHLHRNLGQIKDLGKKAGAVLNPSTPLDTLEYCLELCDLVLIMSVNPGFGGQSFIESQVQKIRDLRELCNKRNLDPWIEVDGGIKASNAWKVIEAGANAIVSYYADRIDKIIK